jgi:hypothetical protein
VLVEASVSVVRGSQSIGTITFGVRHSMRLSARSRHFTEHITISDVRTSGGASGVRLGLRASCPSPCSATVHFPRDTAITDGLSGVINYEDGIAAGHAQVTRSLYTLEFTRPGDRPGSFSYRLPIGYRCDDELPGLPAGCAFPGYWPYLTSLAGLPAVSGTVRAAQNGPAHDGRPGHHPLHRITSATRATANYAAACGSPVVGTSPAGDACDEYPFRSSAEGGTAVSAANRRVSWVPAGQEGAKNNAIDAFYAASRVLDGDPFWVLV